MTSKRIALYASAPAALVVALYAQVLGHEFVNLDDNLYVTENPMVRDGLTWDGILWAFTSFHGGHYHPLTFLSHMIDCEIWGLEPGAHAFTNVIFHSANAALLFLFAFRVTKRPLAAMVAAILFAIHPLNVESVAWIAERKNVLSMLFWLAGMHAYVSYRNAPSLARYMLVTLLLILGLLAKPTVVALPAALVLLDFWRLQPDGDSLARRLRVSLFEKLPWFALVALFSMITIASQDAAGALASPEDIGWSQRIANAFVAAFTYLAKLAWPVDLAAFYPLEPIRFEVAALAGIAVCGLTVLAIRIRSRWPHFTMAWFWYLVTSLPTIGLVHVGGQAMADRFTYIPFLGLFLAIGMAVCEFEARWPRARAACRGGIVLIAVSLSVTTYRQVTVWSDSVSLFTHALAITGDRNFFAHNNLGFAFDERGELEHASQHYAAAVRIHPGYPEAQNNLGRYLARTGRMDEALAHFETAVAIRPEFVAANYNLGLALVYLGRGAEAEGILRRVLELDSGYAEAHLTLGGLCERRGDRVSARDHYQALVQLRPDSDDARQRLARVEGGRLK